MNAPDSLPSLVAPDPAAPGRIAALDRFRLEEFQHLSRDDLLLAQSIAGHGDEWGVWKTPNTISPGKLHTPNRAIDLAKRLRDFLAKEPTPPVPKAALDALVERGVLHLTHLALLLRLAPTSGRRKTKSQRLKPSSVAQHLYNNLPKLLARAIRRKADRSDAPGLFACLTEDDVRELGREKKIRIELDRLAILTARGWWSDLPPQPDVTRTTNPRGAKPARVTQEIPGEYRSMPDAYLAEIGPRVLWLIRDLGPNLLPLLEDLATCLEGLDWSGMTIDKLVGNCGVITKFIVRHLSEHRWMDRGGKPLQPNFPLTTGARSQNKFEWPPRTYQHLQVLSATLQSAHLFLTLLASAGRISEVDALPRYCVSTARDGKEYARGWTYKLSGNLFGDARQWPAPVVLVQALGQQARLATVWSRLPPGRLEDGLPMAPPAHESMWLSLGTGGYASGGAPLGGYDTALQMLAIRVGMDPKPGGTNLHAHRFRKTIGRLAGVALFNSPLVLKRLFGHKDIDMTLHYILCDPGIRTEAEAVLRELRILNCAEALEEVREAIVAGATLPGHGGAPAARLVEAVQEHEARLAKAGRVWADGSAYELAYLMTANGQGWRFIQKNIVCTKVPGEEGLCRKKRNRGEPDTSNCKPECGNRIVLALERRDVGEVVESYLDVARRARLDEQYMVLYEAMQRFAEELDAFPEIKAQYLADPDVKSLLTACQELPQ
jgi:hypothetical protein